MISRQIQLEFAYRACFTRDVFAPENPVLSRCLRNPSGNADAFTKALIFVDEALARTSPLLLSRMEHYFQETNCAILPVPPVVLPGGESCKNDWALVESVWQFIHEAGLCRHSYVIAVGGGALLDLVGFAAATAHRGIRHVRLPTTTLSQGDGGVGVKNGVNRYGKKNWIGTFAVPHFIINDLDFLRRLPDRECRAGLIEAVKVAVIRDGAFFADLEARLDALARLEASSVEFAVQRSAELHMNHIAQGGDPFELGSARPLDFGHWSAHKLEQLSQFRLRHGEAVAIGMAVDLIYAREQGMMTAESCERVLRMITAIGFHPFVPELLTEVPEGLAILQGLEEFREHLGGRLTVTLATGIGTAVEVHHLDIAILTRVFEELAHRFGSTSPRQPS